MTAFQERLPNDFASLVRRIEALERELQQSRAARRLEAATIGRGGITVQGGAIILKDSDGNEIARMGAREDLGPEPDGDTQPGFILRRNDGSVAFTLDDPDPTTFGYRQLLKMNDLNGNIIFSEDYTSGWGLSTPTFSIPLYNQLDPDVWPGTTNSSFTGMWMGYAPAWNPVLQIGARGTMTAGTGQMRLTINSIPVGDVINLSASTFSDFNWTVVVPELADGEFLPGQPLFISIEVRRSSSTATDKAQATALWVYGQGSDAVL